MDSITNKRYDKVKLGQLQGLIVDMLRSNPIATKVLIEIATNDPEVQQNDNLKGVTKLEMQSSINLDRNGLHEEHGSVEKKNSGSKLSQKVMDDAISYLDGATLVYFTQQSREKRWMLTSRGEDVLSQMLSGE